jgi:hypothetical protein
MDQLCISKSNLMHKGEVYSITFERNLIHRKKDSVMDNNRTKNITFPSATHAALSHKTNGTVKSTLRYLNS